MYDPRRPQQNPRSRKTELEGTRAKRVLRMILLGIEGVMITNAGVIDGDFRAAVRAATFATRRAMDGGATAHAALLEHLAPVFVASPRAQVKPGYEDAEL